MTRLLLTGPGRLEVQTAPEPQIRTGYRRLAVQYCAVCRTDAKMWHEGHRDLVLPRVLGHELAATDENGRWYTVWPGHHCGRCRYCRAGQENLCRHIKITGFHHDGGFADVILVPEASLIPVPATLHSPLACFAEPVGCVLHALEKLALEPEERLIIYGGGTLGLIAALMGRKMGVAVQLIEKNETKIAKAGHFLKANRLQCAKDTTAGEFDAVLNACADPIAFSLGVVKLGKGGRYAFFSGLVKNHHLETNLINLLHYKEAQLHGAYGLTRQNMSNALAFIDHHRAAFELLTEQIVSPHRASEILPDVLNGRAFKYILDFCSVHPPLPSEALKPVAEAACPPVDTAHLNRFSPCHRALLARIEPVNAALRPAAQRKIDNKTKPLGALGRLEDLAVRMSMIQDTLNPCLNHKALLVFAADHGVTEEGVSAFPSEVTGQMVANFLGGGAAINVLCRHNNIDLKVVDMGVDAGIEPHPLLHDRKVRRGTRNFALEPAMTSAEMIDALQNGMDVFEAENARRAIDIIGLGEMGIGNTTSATAIICAVTGLTPRRATGRGSGVDDKGVAHKSKIIANALRLHRPDPVDGFDLLCKIGGYEIAGMAGAALAAAAHKTAVVLDGLISTAAGLIAYLIDPTVGVYLIAGHRSVETAQSAALEYMHIDPLIDFNLRLGEGTGAALAIDVVDAACRIMREMASFDEAGVSGKK